MRMSEERISHLAHRVVEALWRGDLVDFPDEGRALTAVKAALATVAAAEDEVDAAIRDKLTKQRKVVGSREWQIMYERYHREEMEKRGWV